MKCGPTFPRAPAPSNGWEEIGPHRFFHQGQGPAPTVRRMGVVRGAAEFDPCFFKISAREARTMDPRQRLLLQESWNALEDAGLAPDRLSLWPTGMFVGAETGDYLRICGGRGPVTSRHQAMLSSRLAYFLNLKGPNMVINTTCSSSLVALHLACKSLLNGECDIAMVGGVNLIWTRETLLEMEKTEMLTQGDRLYAF